MVKFTPSTPFFNKKDSFTPSFSPQNELLRQHSTRFCATIRLMQFSPSLLLTLSLDSTERFL